MLRILVVAALTAVSALPQAAPPQQFLLRIAPVRQDLTLQNLTAEERQLGAEHFAYLKGLFADGKIAFAGQVLDPKGLWGIIVVNAPDAEAAMALLNGDPSVKAKMFRGEAIPFRTVLQRPPQ
jgi:uncharacterized protein YciI